MAGTYWRIFGHPQNGIQCFRWALSAVPKKYEDVVLTNLAGMYTVTHGNMYQLKYEIFQNLILGLLYKTGAIDEALILMKDAILIDEKDPDSNFFIANLYSAKVTEQ